MPKTLKNHEDVGEEFLRSTPSNNRLTHIFPFPREAVWAALIDADAWTVWLPIDKVTWTSPEPLALGATRTVEIGGDRIDEYFFAWDEKQRMAFRFSASTLPIRAFAEDYTLQDSGSGCALVWRFHCKAFPLLTPFLNARMRKSGRTGFPKLERFIQDNPARFGI